MCAARSHALGGGVSGAASTLERASGAGAPGGATVTFDSASVVDAFASKETAHDAVVAQQSRVAGASHPSSEDGALSVLP